MRCVGGLTATRLENDNDTLFYGHEPTYGSSPDDMLVTWNVDVLRTIIATEQLYGSASITSYKI
jgi:hypothetical protein